MTVALWRIAGAGRKVIARSKGVCGGEGHGTAADDRRPRAVPRRPYADDAARSACTRDRRVRRGRLQAWLCASVFRRNCTHFLGLFALPVDGHDRRLGEMVFARGAAYVEAPRG